MQFFDKNGTEIKLGSVIKYIRKGYREDYPVEATVHRLTTVQNRDGSETNRVIYTIKDERSKRYGLMWGSRSSSSSKTTTFKTLEVVEEIVEAPSEIITDTRDQNGIQGSTTIQAYWPSQVTTRPVKADGVHS